ncbi:lipoyl(octanoyl) transferase LipB [Candidatus Profftella armatura]|uniref:Octanoyltransferase n=1 Tax=Candidatus Profftella armatura TaxID=669502 RepID=S5R8K6_9PROT|nr:lipoyl(octanoyl) transferase LipB [Candidatus Profftella armatura]AGS06920.1 lipoate-protein ligase B [Candidatus Profftella armatura]ALC95999.1 lipoate--protein ligase [Candidatus Profftella armatura]QLK13828.1 lipoyl(octanoyl) transferase LipB [Candidatus Profftella armatura]
MFSISISSTYSNLQIIQRGLEPYIVSFNAMLLFNSNRTNYTIDQLWFVEHFPVYTLGLKSNFSHILISKKLNNIPIIRTDRGGEVTYHGPGQAIIYLLIDLRRRYSDNIKIYIKKLVENIEEAVILTMSQYNINCKRKKNAPGVYIANGPFSGAKIASIGLKISAKGYVYHGVSINVSMDLEPFNNINPCGYPGLVIVDMKKLGINTTISKVQHLFIKNFFI